MKDEIDFCSKCRQVIDSLLVANLDNLNIYIEIKNNTQPDKHYIIVSLCEECKKMCLELAGDIDGFIVANKKELL